LTTSPNPVLVQNAVTLTAIVASSVGTPTGSVIFSDIGTTLAMANLNGGAATLTISTLAVGSQSITAVYGGDGNFNSESSTAVNEIIEDFTLTTNSSSQTVQPGGTATYTLPMSPSGGLHFLLRWLFQSRDYRLDSRRRLVQRRLLPEVAQPPSH
jgi:hypothetical protein